ncbi:MAG: hypothetical protein WBC77_12360 [Candidatus Zixiibacteriota bacterium]
MIVKYAVAWLLMPIIGIINGTIRQYSYSNALGELRAHQVSTVTGIFLFGLYIWALTLLWKIRSSAEAIAIGLVWLTLTVAFEFLFGHYVMKHPWSRLLHDYNIFEGRLWVLVLLWVTLAPYVFHKLSN